MNASEPLIVSPHLDDAVLSCWHLLEGGAHVVNVFTGSPSESDGIHPWWDRMTGATDSRARVDERIAEDRGALALAGVEPVNLGFLDEQYRVAGQPLEPLVEAIAEVLDDDRILYAPAGLGLAGEDHRLAGAAALALAERRDGEVHLYADLPHALKFGWPSWVTGETGPLEPAHAWEQQMRAARIPAGRLSPAIHRLDSDQQRKKLEAVLAYRTQLAALDFMFGGLARPGRLEYEVTWRLAPAGVRRAGARRP